MFLMGMINMYTEDWAEAQVIVALLVLLDDTLFDVAKRD